MLVALLGAGCGEVATSPEQAVKAAETMGWSDVMATKRHGMAPQAEPTNCKEICRGDGEGTCCFARCVCETDPDSKVRESYCADVPNLCKPRVSR